MEVSLRQSTLAWVYLDGLGEKRTGDDHKTGTMASRQQRASLRHLLVGHLEGVSRGRPCLR